MRSSDIVPSKMQGDSLALVRCTASQLGDRASSHSTLYTTALHTWHPTLKASFFDKLDVDRNPELTVQQLQNRFSRFKIPTLLCINLRTTGCLQHGKLLRLGTCRLQTSFVLQNSPRPTTGEIMTVKAGFAKIHTLQMRCI
jgi:hypothetical protein